MRKEARHRARRSRLARSSVLERVVLGLGIATALALGIAALRPAADAELAAEARLARLAGETADALRGEWDRSLAQDPGALGLGNPFALPADAPPPQAIGRDRAVGEALPVAVHALQVEAQASERQGELGRALELVLDALALEPPPGLRGKLRLRAVQLAVRLGRVDVARVQWAAARGEVPPDALHGDLPLRLLVALAAAPALDDAERAADADLLSAAWLAGELALPLPGARLALEEGVVIVARSELRADLAERLVALLAPSAAQLEPVAQDPAGRSAQARAPIAARLEHAGLDAERRALDALFQPLPLPPEAGARLAVAAAAGFHCAAAVARGADGGLEVRLGRLEDVAAAFAARVERAGLLPEGFALELVGAELQRAASGGDIVRETTALVGPALGFTLRHVDAPGFLARERARGNRLRAGLLALAALSFFAAALSYRALRRERGLEALRLAFIAGVSHDLRTPLASILLLAENLENGRTTRPERIAQYHTSIRREAWRLRRLVDDVLDFARLERGGRMEIEPEETSLAELAEALGADARELCERAGGALTFSRSGLDGRSAELDASALRRAGANLVDNALRHGAPPALPRETNGVVATPVELVISADAGQLTIEVRDNGPGVPSGEHEAIFQPWARLGERGERAGEGGLPAQGSGSGLGLAIVAEIARAHGGNARCLPAPNSGARFALVVPLVGNGTAAVRAEVQP